MRFGFDIDDTLINLRGYAFQLYNEELKKNVGVEEFLALKTLEIHEPFGLTAEEGGSLWNRLSERIYYDTCPTFEGALEALLTLEKEGHEIYYITARKPEHSERTKKWLKQNGFPIKEDQFYCGMKDNEKIHIIRDLKLDFYFDDKPAVLETLVNIPTKIFAINHSYNQHLDVDRITNWSEMEKVLVK